MKEWIRCEEKHVPVTGSLRKALEDQLISDLCFISRDQTNISKHIQDLTQSAPCYRIDFITEAKNWLLDVAPAHVDWRHPAHRIDLIRLECVDILFRICESYKSSSDIVCSSVALLDLFLMAACRIPAVMTRCHEALAALATDDPSLIAVTVFLVACKFRERCCPLLRDLQLFITGAGCTAEAIQEAEIILLDATEWNLHYVTGESAILYLTKTDPSLTSVYVNLSPKHKDDQTSTLTG